MVFPEGTRGLNKTYDKRYRLQEFGTGFMRIALETQTPIVPVAVIGAEEQAPAFFDFKSVAKAIGSIPITPGGIGVIELGLTSLLVGFGGPKAGVVAAVLVYRFLAIVPTLVLGLVAAATWKHHHPRRQEALAAGARLR